MRGFGGKAEECGKSVLDVRTCVSPTFARSGLALQGLRSADLHLQVFAKCGLAFAGFAKCRLAFTCVCKVRTC